MTSHRGKIKVLSIAGSNLNIYATSHRREVTISFLKLLSSFYRQNSSLKFFFKMLSYRLQYFSQSARRMFSSTIFPRVNSLSTGPSPPRLPKEDQEIYEKLQRSSTGAFSTPNPSYALEEEPISEEPKPKRQRPHINQSPQSEAKSTLIQETKTARIDARVQATGKGEELHPDVRRGAQPEFEGDKNPKTGEVGGPKNEPLRWGGEADWSYNGRVTDF